MWHQLAAEGLREDGLVELGDEVGSSGVFGGDLVEPGEGSLDALNSFKRYFAAHRRYLGCTNITQRSASAEVRGRAMIVNIFVLGMAYPVGVLLQGELADHWSLRAVTVASGVSLGVCFAVLAVARPRLTDPIARLDQPMEVAHVH